MYILVLHNAYSIGLDQAFTLARYFWYRKVALTAFHYHEKNQKAVSAIFLYQKYRAREYWEPPHRLIDCLIMVLRTIKQSLEEWELSIADGNPSHEVSRSVSAHPSLRKLNPV